VYCDTGNGSGFIPGEELVGFGDDTKEFVVFFSYQWPFITLFERFTCTMMHETIWKF